MKLLILRPEPGATITAGRAEAMGFEAVVAPLFEVRAVAWEAPDPARVQAVMLTSANALRHGGEQLAQFADKPVYAVGQPTAQAARAAGFAPVFVGSTDGAALIERIADDGVRRLLHLCGREHRGLAHPDVAIERRIVYASDALPPPPAIGAALDAGAIALLHSPRAAALFAGLVTDRSRARIAAISAQALAAAGDGWRDARAVDRPTDDRLLALARRMCD